LVDWLGISIFQALRFKRVGSSVLIDKGRNIVVDDGNIFKNLQVESRIETQKRFIEQKKLTIIYNRTRWS